MRTVTEDAVAAPDGAARGAAWLAIVAVVAGVLLAPPSFRPPAFGDGARVASGEVEALRSGRWVVLTAGDDVGDEEPLRTLTGRAALVVPGGRLSLAPGTRLAVIADGAVLEQGAALVESDAIRIVRAGAVTVRGAGAWRVDAAPTARVGVYRGGVAVASGPREASVAPYEQVDLVDGRLGDPGPLRYLASDPWDQRLLAGAIAVDRQVLRLTTSLRSVYGTRLQPPAFYRDFVAVDDVLAAALPTLAPRHAGETFGPPAETLMAVAVTRVLVDRAALGVAEAVTAIADLRRGGASWGIVLRRHDLGAQDLRDTADAALRARAVAVAEGSATPVVGAAGVGPDGPDGAPADGAEPPTPVPSEPDAPDPPPDGSDPGADPDDGGEDGGSSDPVEEAEDGVEDAVGDAGDLLEDPAEEVEDLVDEVPLPVTPPRVLDELAAAVGG